MDEILEYVSELDESGFSAMAGEILLALSAGEGRHASSAEDREMTQGVPVRELIAAVADEISASRGMPKIDEQLSSGASAALAEGLARESEARRYARETAEAVCRGRNRSAGSEGTQATGHEGGIERVSASSATGGDVRKVSEFFRRDCRRYDGGFERY